MKTTPRRILLERHAHADADLARVRRAVLAELRVSRARWWQVAWRELFLVARPAWMGLGVAGVAALGLHLAAALSLEPQHRPGPISREVVEAAREERARLWVESGEPAPSPGIREGNRPPAKPGRSRSAIAVHLWPV
jgi:hypothetical protein